jgi:hypothetical protein
MSGGYFNDQEYSLLKIATDIQDAMEHKRKIGWFDDDTPEQYKICINHFEEARLTLLKAYEMVKCIDYLLKND